MKPLRHIAIEGYTLQTWDTRNSAFARRWNTKLNYISYKFSDVNGKLILNGNNFGVPEHCNLRSDPVLRSLINYILLDSFPDDIPEDDRLALSMYTIEPGPNETPCTFINLDDYDLHKKN